MNARITPIATEQPSSIRRTPATVVLIVGAVALMAALRLVALTSDAYLRLDWSAGLLTDEGFYIHNARNIALFGAARQDEFNNSLISPVLHALQTMVFLNFGPSAVSARLISVAFGLATVVFLFVGVRAAVGHRAAALAALFAGLDHIGLLFSRMALMDTPAATAATGAFAAFACASAATDKRRRWALLAASGVLIALAFVTRSLYVYLFPAPFAALWWSLRRGEVSRIQAKADLAAVGAGLAGALAVYYVVWALPHQAELSRMSSYYLNHQLLPQSVGKLGKNLLSAVFGDYRGISPYLFRHTPILFCLALVAIGWGTRVLRVRPESPADKGHSSGAPTVFVILWMSVGWAALALVNYSPTRYYVTTLPALYAVAAIVLSDLGRWSFVVHSTRQADRLKRAVLGGFLGYHSATALVHHEGTLSPTWTVVVLTIVAIVVGRTAYSLPEVCCRRRFQINKYACLVGGWVLVNTYWLGDWATHMKFTQHEASLRLAAALPAGATIIGDVANGLCLDNRLRAVNVIPGLCNDKSPTTAGIAPRFIAILDDRWKEKFWTEHYPKLVSPERRLMKLDVLRWTVGIYPVEDERASMTLRSWN